MEHRKPTIEELEQILHSEDTRPIQIMPDGSIRQVDEKNLLFLTETEKEQLLSWLDGIKRQQESPTWTLRLTFEEIQAWYQIRAKLEDLMNPKPDVVDSSL
jgi:hypothetical protein